MVLLVVSTPAENKSFIMYSSWFSTKEKIFILSIERYKETAIQK